VDVLSFSSKLTLFISTGTGADDAAALWLVPAIPLADLGLLTGSSTNVFHSLHAGHCPNHLADSYPHSLQKKAVFFA
jgi:hypothetical protein